MIRLRNIILFLFLPGLLFLIYTLGTKSNVPEDNAILTARVTEKNFTITVEAVGELDAVRSTVLFSQIRGDRGIIVSIVKDGTLVKQGDVLVRLDPTFFEEEVRRLTAEVRESEAIVTAQEQILQWEKIQADREVKTVEFDLRVAQLDLMKLEKGDGPLELSRLRGTAQEAEREWKEKNGYLKDLEKLKKQGYANITEIVQARNKASELKETYKIAKHRFESYRDYVLPSLKEKARALVARAKMNLEQVKKGSGFKIGKAKAALRKAQRNLESINYSLKSAQEELEHTIIRAPIPGIVVLPEAFRGGKKRKPRVGDVVWQSQPLIYLPDISKMLVNTQIREIDLHKVRRGKPATLFVDAFPDLRLEGHVETLGVLGEARIDGDRGDKYFQVVISIKKTDPRLRPGMTARVQIECAKVENALCVPIHALFKEQDGIYCYVDTPAGYEKCPVSIGAQNEDWAQILEGLTKGDSVALSRPPSSEIREMQTLSRISE